MIDPLRIDLVELRRKLAPRRTFQREATVPDLVVGSTFVPEDEPVSVELELESVSNGVMVGHAPCRRGREAALLAPLRGAIEVEVQELSRAGPGRDLSDRRRRDRPAPMSATRSC